MSNHVELKWENKDLSPYLLSLIHIFKTASLNLIHNAEQKGETLIRRLAATPPATATWP